jgi:trigger factor
MKVRSDFHSDAEKQVKASLMLAEIGQRENIDISPEELEQEVGKMAGSMEQPTEKVQQYFQQEGRLEDLKKQLIQQKAMKCLVESADISDS